ncbi:MAG: helix-turn-helix domain-containing protein [Bacillota bacterium]
MRNRNRLNSLLNERGITRNQLSSAVDIAAEAIERYENNIFDASSKEIDAIASFFDVSVDYLLCRTDVPHLVMKSEGNLPDTNIKYKTYDEIFNRLSEVFFVNDLTVDFDAAVPKVIIEKIMFEGIPAALELLNNKKDD